MPEKLPGLRLSKDADCEDFDNEAGTSLGEGA